MTTQKPVPPLYGVSTRTYIVLSLCTLGLYELYWCYQNWKRLQIASGEDLSPFWRALFAPLWSFSLFRRIQARAAEARVPVPWNSNLLATLYLLIALARTLPAPWSWISLFGFVVIIPVQRTALAVVAEGANTDASWGDDRESPADLHPLITPVAAGTTALKPRTAALKPTTAALIAAVLSFLILMAYIGFGLASWLPPVIQTLLWAAVATTGLGLLAAVCGRSRLGLVAFGLTVVNLLWQQHLWDLKLAPQRALDAELRRNENAALLSQALVQVPCTNGDVAILSRFTNTKTKPNFTSLSLEIVPKNRTKKSYILASATGDYRPPDDTEVKRYRSEQGSDCHSAEYASLKAMLEQISKHYWAEHHRFIH